jgi:hypothetical protein
MKMMIMIAMVVLGVLITGMTVLENGSFRNYLDRHPELSWVPTAEYYVGEGYYIVGNLDESATYYQRISDRFPTSKYADDAYFNYLQCLDDMNTPHRPTMIDKYSDYLERFPKGGHADLVQHRIENYRNGR